MDGIFGSDNFRNEIVWCYSSPSNTKKWFPRKHDIILFYAKSNKNWYFNSDKIKVPYVRLNTGSSQHGIFKKNVTLDEKGKNVEDWWTGITPVGRLKYERLGYDTQKPVALLERIIKASCPMDTEKAGVVLDPFCGCGTSIVSAQRLGLKWIGIDISINAIEIIKERLGNDPKYLEVDGDPESRAEYDKLDPFKKQEFLINKVGGICNKKKTGDEGVDGEITVHLGEENGKDKWGKMIISVKTGKQCKPEFIRELIGTVKDKGAVFGGLILEADPSEKMEELAKKQGKIKYSFNKTMPPVEYDKIQILTVSNIIDKKYFEIPNTIQQVKFFRKQNPLGT
jgi:site-specific DNA-methyltransferase (adenine-specific)